MTEGNLCVAVGPMGPADLPQVLCIERQGFSNPWEQRDFEYAMTRPGGMCRVARVDGEVAGYAVGFRVEAECHLADLAVAPDRRRRGVGRALLSSLETELREAGSRVVTLEVRVSNAAAIALYTGQGYRKVAMRKDYYVRPREDAVVMVRALQGRLSDWVAREAAKPFQRPDNP